MGYLPILSSVLISGVFTIHHVSINTHTAASGHLKTDTFGPDLNLPCAIYMEVSSIHW